MKSLKALRELQEQLGAEVFVVGGAVRDLVRNQKPNDLDLLVRNVAPADFENFLRDRGDLRLVGKSFGVYLFRPKHSKVSFEIAFPRTEVSTGPRHRDFKVCSDPSLSLEEDSSRRDFTLNSMYLPIDKLGEDLAFDRKDIIDFHRGQEHISERLIVFTGRAADRIEEDPVRMMRAMVLVARTGYRLEGSAFSAIRRRADLIKQEAAERVRDEFVKLMMTDKPSRGFKAMQRTGLLQHVLPELADCVGCGQNPKYHSYPVFEHLIYATDAACSISNRLDVRFGALCHDLGKAPTRQVRPGGNGPDDVSFHNHEIVSTKLTYAFMRRLKFPKDITDRVIHLVRYHQYKYDRTWTDKAIRRFIRNCGITKEDLGNLDNHPQFLVRQADRMGNELKAHLPITQKQKDFQERIIAIYNQSTAHSLKDLAIDGNDLKKELGLKPGPTIGKLITKLFDLVETDPTKNTRETLLAYAKQLKDLPEEEMNEDDQRDLEGSDPGAFPTGEAE